MKEKTRGGREGGERHGRDDWLFVERQNDPRNWVTRHVDRISCGVFHCGSQKRARKRRSLAPLTILWIVRALASSHSSSLVNIQSTKYYTNEKHFSRGGNNGPRHDWSIEERDFGKNSQERGRGFGFFESKKYRGEMYPLLFVVVTKMKNQFDDA